MEKENIGTQNFLFVNKVLYFLDKNYANRDYRKENLKLHKIRVWGRPDLCLYSPSSIITTGKHLGPIKVR